MVLNNDSKISGSSAGKRWEAIGNAFGSVREAIAKILGGYQERGKSSRLAQPPQLPSYGSPARSSSAPPADTKVSSGTPTRQGGGGMNVTAVSPQQTQAYEVLKKMYDEKKLQELGYTGPQDISAEKAREILLGQAASPAPLTTATPTPATAPATTPAPATPTASPSAPAFSPPPPPAPRIDIENAALDVANRGIAADNRAADLTLTDIPRRVS